MPVFKGLGGAVGGQGLPAPDLADRAGMYGRLYDLWAPFGLRTLLHWRLPCATVTDNFFHGVRLRLAVRAQAMG